MLFKDSEHKCLKTQCFLRIPSVNFKGALKGPFLKGRGDAARQTLSMPTTHPHTQTLSLWSRCNHVTRLPGTSALYGYFYGGKRMHKCMFCASRMLCACIDVSAHSLHTTCGHKCLKTQCFLRIASVNLHTCARSRVHMYAEMFKNTMLFKDCERELAHDVCKMFNIYRCSTYIDVQHI